MPHNMSVVMGGTVSQGRIDAPTTTSRQARAQSKSQAGLKDSSHAFYNPNTSKAAYGSKAPNQSYRQANKTQLSQILALQDE